MALCVALPESQRAAGARGALPAPLQFRSGSGLLRYRGKAQNAVMAVVTQPGIVTILAADGRLAGPVLIHIRRTAAFRRAYPSKKLTVPQRRSANAFRYVDARWKLMSYAQRSEWNQWRSWERNWGYNRFQRVNIPRRIAGLPILLSPPTL